MHVFHLPSFRYYKWIMRRFSNFGRPGEFWPLNRNSLLIEPQRTAGAHLAIVRCTTSETGYSNFGHKRRKMGVREYVYLIFSGVIAVVAYFEMRKEDRL